MPSFLPSHRIGLVGFLIAAVTAQEPTPVVESGRLSDLVLLDARPLKSIQTTRRIHAVAVGRPIRVVASGTR